MFLKHIFLGIIGLSFGMFAAGGVFTVLISVGLIPRFAGKMHVSSKVFLFEEAVVLGTLLGDFISVFERSGRLGDCILKNELFGSGRTEVVWHAAGTVIIVVFGLFAGFFQKDRLPPRAWHRRAGDGLGKSGGKPALFCKSHVFVWRDVRNFWNERISLFLSSQ